jgi:hypothetical protein
MGSGTATAADSVLRGTSGSTGTVARRVFFALVTGAFAGGITGSTGGATNGSVGTTGAGASATRRSVTSARRSFHGKLNPGSQSWPPKVTLRSHAWTSSEKSSPRKKPALAATPLGAVELERALQLRTGFGRGLGASLHHVPQPDPPKGHDLLRRRRHS